MLRRLPFLMAALFFVDFLDEFSAGVPTVGIPGLEATFSLGYTAAAFLVFTAPIFVALLLEPPLFMLADRLEKKHFIVVGFLAMGVLDLTVGLSDTFWIVACALALSGVASGCGVSLSQATLMDSYPDDRERLMARWTLAGSIGDLAAPALFWALAWFALGWREAFVTTGVVLLGYALLLACTDFQRPARLARGDREQGRDGPAPEHPGWREALRAALANRSLRVWLVAVWLCSLLDEVLIAFGALFMRDHLGADNATRSLILMSMMIGATLGLILFERMLSRAEPLSLLKVAGLGTIVAYLGWLTSDTPIASGVWMFWVGFFSSSLYPIAKAQAYRALPGSSGMVNAVRHVFTPLDLLLPLLLGLVADQFGLIWALSLLIAQPVGLVAIAFFAPEAPRAQANRIG